MYTAIVILIDLIIISVFVGITIYRIQHRILREKLDHVAKLVGADWSTLPSFKREA